MKILATFFVLTALPAVMSSPSDEEADPLIFTGEEGQIIPEHFANPDPSMGCCATDEASAYCNDKPGDIYSVCSTSKYHCYHKCHGIWLDVCEKKELEGCCYRDSNEDKGWRALSGGGSQVEEGCSDSCWCNINEHNCHTYFCAGHWIDRTESPSEMPSSLPSSVPSESPTSYPTSGPTQKPTDDPTCMSGDTGIIQVLEDESTQVIALKNVQPGNKVQGLNEALEVAVCDVITLGAWGQGTTYGNYTRTHYMYDSGSQEIVQHGEVGEDKVEDVFVLMTTCPLARDEVGNFFTPLDGFIFPRNEILTTMSWEYYVKVYKIIAPSVTAVPETLSLSAFIDFDALIETNIFDAAITCAEEGVGCVDSVNVIESSLEYYVDSVKTQLLTLYGPLLALRDTGNATHIQAALRAAFQL